MTISKAIPGKSIIYFISFSSLIIFRIITIFDQFALLAISLAISLFVFRVQNIIQILVMIIMNDHVTVCFLVSLRYFMYESIKRIYKQEMHEIISITFIECSFANR